MEARKDDDGGMKSKQHRKYEVLLEHNAFRIACFWLLVVDRFISIIMLRTSVPISMLRKGLRHNKSPAACAWRTFSGRPKAPLGNILPNLKHPQQQPQSSRLTLQQRSSSSHANNLGGPLKAYPQYNIFGESCMLAVKLMPPTFRYLPSNTLVMDGNKKGRLLLEWIPRNADGSVTRDRDAVIRFALSPEEVGLLMHQLPRQQMVEFVRRPASPDGVVANSSSFATNAPHKVCRVIPSEADGSVNWVLDLEVDGVGSQPGPAGLQVPLSVAAQAGEVQVMLQLFRTSLPVLAGWSTLMDVAMEKTKVDALEGVAGGGYGGGGGRPSDVPF